MAVISTTLESYLQLQLQTGTDPEGNPVLVTRSFSRVKPGATDQDVYDIGQALAGLQVHTLQAVYRVMDNYLNQAPA